MDRINEPVGFNNLNKISGRKAKPGLRPTAAGSAKQEKQVPDKVSIGQEKKDPGSIVVEFVCSKGDREYHTINESFQAVRAHELRHIEEYHEIAGNLGLMVVNPQVSVFSKFFPKLNTTVAIGGHARCQFAARINGQTVVVDVTSDGRIADMETAKKLKDARKRKTKLLPDKKNKMKKGGSRGRWRIREKDKSAGDGYNLFDRDREQDR